MSPPRRSDDGVPHATRDLSRGAAREEQWAGANQEKDEKLRLRSVQRRAGEGGFELRHSDYGYALIDAGRKPVNARNDLSLKEVESLLAEALGR